MYTSGTGATSISSCLLCPANLYVADTGADTGKCLTCHANAGSESGSIGSGSCTCNAGYTESSTLTCDFCEAGKYKADPGNEECTLCLVGKTYGNHTLMPEKPGSLVGISESSSCYQCEQHYYYTLTDVGRCLPCPLYSETQASGASHITHCECIVGYGQVSETIQNI